MPVIPRKTADIVVEKIEEKKMKKGVDFWVLVWYINRAPVERHRLKRLEGNFKKVEKDA